jgi:hypothetical protein
MREDARIKNLSQIMEKNPMRKNPKSIMIASAALAVLFAAPLSAHAEPSAASQSQTQNPSQDPSQNPSQNPPPAHNSPIIEIGVGFGVDATSTYTPCVQGCGGRGTDVRSDSFVRFGFDRVAAVDFVQSGRLKFLPILLTLDGGGRTGFGDVGGANGGVSRVRQVMGVLVDSKFIPNDGALVVRGKLVQLAYDRDKGFTDIRGVDASVGLRASRGDSTKLDVEVDAGLGMGAVALNNMRDISEALGAAPALTSYGTVDPYLALRAGLRSESLTVAVMGQAEHRISLDSAEYDGRRIDASSNHAAGTLEVEYVFGKKGLEEAGSRKSVFADAIGDVDSLTLSNMLFDSGSTYRSFMGLAGFRAQF